MVRETAKNDITLGHGGKIRNKPNFAQANCNQWVTVSSERAATQGKRGESGPTSRAGALLFVPAAGRRLSRRLSREAAPESSLGWSRNGGTLG